jgi:hypothetical protein
MTPADAKKLKEGLAEISGSMTRTEGERDFVNESLKILCEELSINKRVLRKVARAYHKQNLAEEQAINTEVEELYEELYQK